MAQISAKRSWAWVNAVCNRIETFNADARAAGLSWSEQIPEINVANDPEEEDRPFVLWESWEQIRKIARLVAPKGMDEDGEPFAVDNYPDFEDRVNGGFCDEYTTCSDCNRVIRTSPDSYFWQPDFHVGDGYIWCRECIKENAEDYIKDMAGKAVNPDVVDPADHGYVKIDHQFQSGHFAGMNDNPQIVHDRLEAQDIESVFTANPSQFYTDWYVWVPEDKLTQALEVLGVACSNS